ncbi:MAG TPA: arylesterase [Chthoniobacterales bacterium]|nr:arylesterase [Chthoniobacterales bacterium]
MGKLTPLICRCLLPFLVWSAEGRAQTEAAPSPAAKKTIVFLGDSLSAGLGVKLPEAFPALIEQKIEEEGLPFVVVNAGLSGDTTAGGLSRINWVLQRPADVLVLELGGNDGLRGLPIANIKANLQAIIDQARAKNPEVKIVIAGMQMPPNVGAQYAMEFRQMFFEVATANKATMIPFLLEGVGGAGELNQADLIHPNARGHKIVAEVVWKILEPLLRQGGSR